MMPMNKKTPGGHALASWLGLATGLAVSQQTPRGRGSKQCMDAKSVRARKIRKKRAKLSKKSRRANRR